MTYVAKGSVRGSCGHSHRSLRTATACAARDAKACASLGGGAYSDRIAVRADGVPLSEDEIDELARLAEEAT